MDHKSKRYFDLNTHLRNRFGGRVQKVTVDAGLTCPNRDGNISNGGCIYCNPKGSGTGAFSAGMSITEQILTGKKHMGRRYKAKMFMAYFQSFTNTYAPVEKLKAIYDEALSVEGVVALSIGTRPDCVDEDILDLLEGYAGNHLVWIEYGLQSVHDRTLKLINRGHDFECFRKAVEMTKNRGIKICAHVILGLPGETREDMLDAARALGELGVDGVKIHLLYVVKGTPLEEMYNSGKLKCLSQREYAEIVCDFIELLPPDMVIQRITGDPHVDELVAPFWSLRKDETMNMINNTLIERGTRQGAKYAD